MKLMTYNILGGWQDRIELILGIIEEESPDYLVLNEANAFIPDVEEHLEVLSSRTGLSYSASAPSGEDSFHVVVLSKKPFKRVVFLAPLARAGLLAVVDTEFGELALVGTHLTPYAEEPRLEEVETILTAAARFDHAVIMGDLNALSPEDEYGHLAYEKLNEKQQRKFATGSEIRFDAIGKILSSGFVDAAVVQEKNDVPTAPTAIKEDAAHANMRLDYIFVSSSLTQHVQGYEVVKGPDAEVASDHYPITAQLKRVSGKSAEEVRHQIIEDEWFDFEWAEEKVWELDVEAEPMPLERLEWHLSVPLWDYDGESHRLAPREVIDSPEQYPEQFQEIMESDTSYPIDIMWWKERWMILDGVHRLAKARHQGKRQVAVRKIPRSAIPSIRK